MDSHALEVPELEVAWPFHDYTSKSQGASYAIQHCSAAPSWAVCKYAPGLWFMYTVTFHQLVIEFSCNCHFKAKRFNLKEV